MIIKISSASLFTFTIIIFSYSCKKDPCIKDCPTPPSCKDGIRNQNEERIDCGGPCTSCSEYACKGNGTNTYFPLNKKYWWDYNHPPGVTYVSEYDKIIMGDTIINSYKYYKMAYGFFDYNNISLFEIFNYEYFRKDLNGDIYAYLIIDGLRNGQLASSEKLYLPANPYVGQYWKHPGSFPDSFVVASINISAVNFSNCDYTDLIEIKGYYTFWQNLTWPNESHVQTTFYKKGVGMVLFARHSPIFNEYTTLWNASIPVK